MGYLAQKKELDDMKKTLLTLHEKYADIIKADYSSNNTGLSVTDEEFKKAVTTLIRQEIPANTVSKISFMNTITSKLAIEDSYSYADNNTMVLNEIITISSNITDVGYIRCFVSNFWTPGMPQIPIYMVGQGNGKIFKIIFDEYGIGTIEHPQAGQNLLKDERYIINQTIML